MYLKVESTVFAKGLYVDVKEKEKEKKDGTFFFFFCLNT